VVPSGDFWKGQTTNAPDAARWADRAFQFRLARMLGRTVDELLHGGPGHRPISNAEYEEWIGFLVFERELGEFEANKVGLKRR